MFKKYTLTLTAILLSFNINASAGEIFPPYYYHLKPSDKTIIYDKGKPFVESVAYGREDGRKWTAVIVVRSRICSNGSLKKYEIIDIEDRKAYRDINLDGKFDEVEKIKDLQLNIQKVPWC